MINWKIRLKNKNFWLAIVPAVLLLVQAISSVFGYTVDFSDLQGKLIAVVNAIFTVLAIVGIVVDPTTSGISDSTQALTYDAPRKDGGETYAKTNH